jgi:hypothetical protein
VTTTRRHSRREWPSAPWPFADGVQAEENGVNVISIDDGSNLVFRGCERSTKLPSQIFSNFREDIVVIGDDGERIALQAGAGFGQICVALVVGIIRLSQHRVTGVTAQVSPAVINKTITAAGLVVLSAAVPFAVGTRPCSVSNHEDAG